MKRRLKFLAAAGVAAIVTVPAALAASSPDVVTGGTSTVSESSAVLHGTVNPNGSGTTYYFQWGLTTQYGVNGNAQSAGSGTKPVAVQQTASSLVPGTTYHYRLVASNRYGTSTGADRSFTTAGHPPPVTTTGPATALSANGATLTGVISPNGQSTSWTFQYGLTSSYGMETFGGTIAPGSSTVNVASQLQGLEPGTIFHYRVVATHGGTTASYGDDATFMTYPSPRPVPGVRAQTKPRFAARRPYVLTTTGSVRIPARIPSVYGCNGNVEVRFFDGRRQVAFTFVAVQSNCAFSGATTFRRLPGRGKVRPPVALKVIVRFLGNPYLAPNRASDEHVTLG